MTRRFFIMMYSQGGDSAMPMTEGETYDVKFFETEDESREAGDGQFFAKTFGYEIFEMGGGE